MPKFGWILETVDVLFSAVVFCYVLLLFEPTSAASGNTALLEITSVVGGDAWLPCNVTPAAGKERPVALVLWYKDNASTPVYTVDARWGSLLQGARHFPGEEELADRLSFDGVHQPALLRVSHVEPEDAGMYRCRVDYRQARTAVTLSLLHVIVPPRAVIVLDEHGQRQVDVLGPYNEGATVMLVCEVEGGDPPPEALWFRDGELVDTSFSVLRPQGVVRNELRLGPLRRRDLLAEVVCSASNTNLTEPLTSSLRLDLNLKPTEVKVTLPALSLSKSGDFTLVADEVAEAQCLAVGARPLAQVAWFKGGHRLLHDRLVSQDAGSTLSAISFVVRPEDHGAVLTCRADNPSLPGSEISDSLMLDVQYPPRMSLTASDRRPREGDNVTMRCDWSANPAVTAIWWRHDGRLLEWRDEFVDLVNVTRAQSGLYECLASNRLGEGYSNQIRLSVLFAPECAESQTEEYAASPELRVACEVRANPSDELHFEWLANTTKRTGRINSLAVNGTRALARAVASRELEYGLLLCWASNSVGKQREPCVFRIVPPAPPGDPKNCTVARKSHDSVVVRCHSGHTGGLPVTFFAELLSARSPPPSLLLPLTNATAARWPEFEFAGLQPGRVYLVRVYAANSHGRSGVMEVRFSAGRRLLIDSEPAATTDGNATSLPGHVLGFLGTVVVALACAIICLTFAKYRKHRRKRKGMKETIHLQKASPQKSFCECGSGDVVYQSPDLITSKCGMSGQVDIAAVATVLRSKSSGDSGSDGCYHETRVITGSLSPTVPGKP
ncbi:kin of IRRE-like protein 2 isoform X2 [Rhipicephalus microplus]|uniref:kin of IRRE-like protein 2 isoform X2 n=1 Tax=Rhipicephalus microplus TaxID=6941 RepID=UPI003F6B4C9F